LIASVPGQTLQQMQEVALTPQAKEAAVGLGEYFSPSTA